MYKQEISELINVATRRETADIVIKNAKIVDVYQSKIIEGDLAIHNKHIVGIGNYEAKTVIDARGGYIIPGLIDSHIHIESTYLSPGEAGRMVVPHGTTTIIADPHEIVNCCGIDGLEYMLDATDNTALDIKYMMPSCVPCTPFETSGAVITAKDMEIPFTSTKVLGLGELMDYVGVNAADEDVIAKINEARQAGKLIDGHAPGLSDELLNAYVSAGVHTDHECSSVKEMEDRLSRGMYVQLRQGSACRDLRYLIPGITKENSRYCVLCSDDREPKTIIEQGHIDDHLRICVSEGVDPITAIQMATINAAQCYRLYDRGGIAPGLLANIVIVDNLEDFNAKKVFIEGELVAENGEYLKTFVKQDISKVSSAMNIKDFSMERLRLKYDFDEVIAMQTLNDGVLTKKIKVKIDRNENGEFLYNKKNLPHNLPLLEPAHPYKNELK
jgi:adenine deaminase